MTDARLGEICGLGVLLAFAPACSRPDGDVIRFGIPTAPVTLDPRRASDAASISLCRLLYLSPVDFNEGHEPVPGLAAWQRLAPRRYRFTLGTRGRRFHDGGYLTAEDVEATYRWMMEPRNGSPHAGSFRIIERVEVIGEDEIDFFLRREDPLFPGRLTVGILPREAIERGHPFDERPLGSGPLRFLERGRDGTVSLERRRDGQRIDFPVVPEPAVRLLKLARRELDLIQGNVPYDLRPWVERRGDLSMETRRGNVFTYLGFNLRDPVVGDERVRRAIAHAIDRDAVIRYLFRDEAWPAAAAMPPGHWLAAPGLERYAYEPDRARALLKRAGYSDERPAELTYKTSNDPFRIRLATAIQHQLGQVGIRVKVLPQEWGTFYGDVKAGRFQLYSLSWVGIRLPDFFRYAFHSESTPPAGANRGRFTDPLADELIERAERAEELQDALPYYLRLQRRLHRKLPYVPLWHESYVLVRHADVRGYRLNAAGNYDPLTAVTKTIP